jgi:hypothetical protein
MTQRLDDGHATFFTLTSPSVIKFWEKEVTPPGMDGGGPNNTTTMRNVDWETKAPKKLKTLTTSQTTVAYDPEVYKEDNFVAALQVNQLITITFPDGSQVKFWGWLDKFNAGNIVQGEQPTATVVIEPSNQDNTGAEVGPQYIGAGSVV